MRCSMARPWVLLVLGLLLVGGGCGEEPQCSATGPRYDCGYLGIQEQECISRGCCWSPVGEQDLVQPWCFTKNTGPSVYRVEDSVQNRGGYGFEAELQSIQSTQPELGPEIPRLSLMVDTHADTVHVKMKDAQSTRFEVPKSVLGGSAPGYGRASESSLEKEEELLRFAYSEEPFSFSISSTKNHSEPLFDTSGHRFIFKDQYLEITSSIPKSSSLFGLSEHTASGGFALPRDGKPITLWNRDCPSEFADQNLYGSHPFVMELREDGTVHGFLLLNSNGMDVVITSDLISLRVIGGILDFYFFAGPSPAAVMEQYTRIIGRPRMPPLWSLGFHQCKYGYKSADEVREVVENYRKADIPLDTMWTDIDYMDAWKDFTLNPTDFPEHKMKAFVEDLHKNEMKYVVIVDPGIKAEKGYPAYERGLAADVFIKDVTGQPYLGQVWPGATHFPDFLNPATRAYWERELRDFHDLLAYDGLWIDMNEAANFCTGEVCHLPQQNTVTNTTPANEWTDCFLKCGTASTGDSARLLNPPYAISNGNALLPLSFRTIPTTATHHDGTLEYNVHNLYGVTECKTTAEALESITNKRSFVLTRSSFPGTGAYAAHWTGDNAATWNDLKWSVSSILDSGLSGIPFVGADICGFIGDTTEELCNRWISAGAFYPFSRDHSDLHASYQELYRWPSVADAGRKALKLRYQLLSYFQTAFQEASHTGAPVARPLWFHYSHDQATHAVDQQWMLGSDVLVSPVLAQGKTSVDAYFPEGVWYDAFTHAAVEGARAHTLDVPLGHVPVHFRGGSILALQQPGLTSAAVRRSPFTLIIALPDLDYLDLTKQRRLSVAKGSLFFEEGDNIKVENSSVVIKLEAAVHMDDYGSDLTGFLTAEIVAKPDSDDGGCVSVPLPPIQDIVLLGWPQNLSRVTTEPAGQPTYSRKSDSGSVHYQPGSFDPQWQRQSDRAVVIKGVKLDWRCQQTVGIAWSSQLYTMPSTF